MAPAAQHLPVKAILEGPSACFRLLDINESLGMKHAEYIGLLYSATDNRYRTLCMDVLWKAPWGGVAQLRKGKTYQSCVPIIY